MHTEVIIKLHRLNIKDEGLTTVISNNIKMYSTHDLELFTSVHFANIKIVTETIHRYSADLK
jgi:hypothetical protein